MYLTKMQVTNIKMVILSILNNIKNDYKGFSITDCFDRVYLYEKDYLPQEFNNKIVFISGNSFQQNHRILSKSIRKFVNSLIENEILLLCIGGESYIYGITNKYIKKIYHYTNSRYIYNDCEYNNKFYKKDLENNHIDYNDDKLIIVSDINVCLINLSNLTKNLINKLDKNNYKKIIIISCHHEDFWKKIKNFKNYKLKKRKYFICDKIRYFITVNIFYKN